MTDYLDLLIHGGPCDAQHVRVQSGYQFGGHFICKSTIYDVVQVGPTEYVAVLPSEPHPKPYDPSATPPAPVTPAPIPLDQGVMAAWRDTWRAMTHGLAADVARVKRSRGKLRAAGR